MKRQVIYILGYPKSGTTWLARLLGDALNSPVGGIVPAEDSACIAAEGQDRPGPYYIRQGHAIPGKGDTPIPDRHTIALEHLTDERIVIMLRDPRDVAVSAAHHWGRDLTTILHCMKRGEWPLTHGGGWCKWVRAWQSITLKRVGKGVYPQHIQYRRLNGSPFLTMCQLVAGFDNCPLDVDISKAIACQSFTARCAYTQQHGDDLNYGKDFQLRFLRKGIVGDWENHFTPEHRQLAEDYFGEMMRELGYTESERRANE